MKAVLFAAMLIVPSAAFAIITAENVGVPGEEQTFLTVLDAHSDSDIRMIGFANVYENPSIQPARLDLSSLSERVYPVQFKMNLGGPVQADYVILNSPANRAVLAEMIPDASVKVMGIKTYSIRYMKMKFTKPRMMGNVPIGSMRLYGLKSITFKTGTGFVFEMDLDPDFELYRYLSLMSEVPLELPEPQGLL